MKSTTSALPEHVDCSVVSSDMKDRAVLCCMSVTVSLAEVSTSNKNS